MNGSVQKRGNKWTVVLSLGRDPATGKYRQKWIGGFATKREAQAKLTELLHQMQTGTYVEPTKETVGAYLSRWLETARQGLGAKTAERYQELIERHVAPRIGSVLLQKLQPLHLQMLYSDLLESGRADGKGGLSAQTVLHVHHLLHRALGQAVKWQLLLRNPADAVEPPKVLRAEQPALDVEQAARLIYALRGTRLYALTLLAAATGLRRGELLGLRWQDVDFKAGTLAVRQTLEQTRQGGLRLKPGAKTAGSVRTETIPGFALEALRKHRAQQAEEKLLLGPAYKDHGLVFAQPDGSPLRPDAISNEFRKRARQVGLEGIHLHSLRHSQASILIALGEPVVVVQHRLGHSSPRVTTQVYSHLLPGGDEEAARRLDEAFRAAFAKLETESR